MNTILQQLEDCSLDELITIKYALSKHIATRIYKARVDLKFDPEDHIQREIKSSEEDWNENVYNIREDAE
jgi:hypothetical protein